ncbi:MAG: hypothetical protein PHT76_11570, partial [Anaerostipes sp.]|nr:hypothetical protein [Anaerostipes sp.]
NRIFDICFMCDTSNEQIKAWGGVADRMNHNILVEYADMREEIKDLRRRISNLERQIDKIVEEGSVTDTVNGGAGGIQHFKVEGFPVPEYQNKLNLLKMRRVLLIQKESKLLELTSQVEEYIGEIDKSELRIMFRFYYIDNLTWTQVAIQMNYMFPKRKIAYTDKNCQKKHERFLEKL